MCLTQVTFTKSFVLMGMVINLINRGCLKRILLQIGFAFLPVAIKFSKGSKNIRQVFLIVIAILIVIIVIINLIVIIMPSGRFIRLGSL